MDKEGVFMALGLGDPAFTSIHLNISCSTGRVGEPTQPIGLQPNSHPVVGGCENADLVELLELQPSDGNGSPASQPASQCRSVLRQDPSFLDLGVCWDLCSLFLQTQDVHFHLSCVPVIR